MNQLNHAPRLIAAILTAIILLSSFQATVHAQAGLDPVVVLYDASHSQQFAADSEDLGLKLILDMVNASTRYIVHINNDDSLTDDILNDVDILIIASPDDSSPFSSEELAGITEMMINGSSLFVLGDPVLSQKSTYWTENLLQDTGDNIALNKLLDGINMTGPRFSINTTSVDDYADIMFDYENALNDTIPWVIHLGATTWDTTHPIFRNINDIYTMTATLKPLSLASGIGKSYESSFAQYRVNSNTWANWSMPNMTKYELNPLSYSAVNGTFPSWLSAFEFGDARVVISGSTIMFTGRPIDIPDTNLNWFYMGDNARLFMNIISWLSDEFVTAPSAIVPMLIISSVFLIVGVAFYLMKKLR
ncbi:hypothetical protein EU527_06210 [Candidatus Thorarchaeota archaeon]|nr:MAG: hypothetical protein EU527_06210 [Candidatus Thorarchaeota archaeon]